MNGKKQVGEPVVGRRIGVGSGTYLDGLRLEGLVGVRHILHGDPVELALVDVGDSVILAPLVRRDGCFQVVPETVLVVSASKTTPFKVS